MMLRKRRLTFVHLVDSGYLRSRGGPLFVSGLTGLGVVATACGAEDGFETTEIGQELSPVTSSFQNGVSPSSGYSGTDDATIRQAAAGTNYGAAVTCEADGDDGGGVDKSCLLSWNVGSIPAGSMVTSVSVTLQVVDGTANTYSLYEVRRPWTESQITWNNATSSTAWATPGALGTTDRGSVVGTVTGGAGSRTISLNAAGVAMVQAWVDGTSSGGIIVASASNTDGIDLAASEHGTLAYRPRLTVIYTPPDTGSSGSIAFRNGASPSSGYSGSTDSTIRQAAAATRIRWGSFGTHWHPTRRSGRSATGTRTSTTCRSAARAMRSAGTRMPSV